MLAQNHTVGVYVSVCVPALPETCCGSPQGSILSPLARIQLAFCVRLATIRTGQGRARASSALLVNSAALGMAHQMLMAVQLAPIAPSDGTMSTELVYLCVLPVMLENM